MCCKAEASRTQFVGGKVVTEMHTTGHGADACLCHASVFVSLQSPCHWLLIYLASYLMVCLWRQNCRVVFGRIGRPPKTFILGSFSNPRSGAVKVWILPCGLRKLCAPSPPFGRLISSWHRIYIISSNLTYYSGLCSMLLPEYYA